MTTRVTTKKIQNADFLNISFIMWSYYRRDSGELQVLPKMQRKETGRWESLVQKLIKPQCTKVSTQME